MPRTSGSQSRRSSSGRARSLACSSASDRNSDRPPCGAGDRVRAPGARRGRVGKVEVSQGVPMQPPAEREILEVGRRLLTNADSSIRSPVRALDERATERASQDAELRTALLRFVDVAPACRSPADLAAHLIGLLGELHERPLPLDAAMRMGSSKAARTALGRAAAAGVRHVAHRFIVAERPGDAEKVLRSLWGEGVTTSVDLLGEATLSSSEADRYAQRCLDTLDALARIYAGLPPMRVLEADSIGPIPRANLSIKVSALTPLLRPEAPELGERDAMPRLRALLRRARERDVHLHVDMESFDSREAVTELVLSLLGEDEFRDGPSAGLVLQAYLVDSPELCKRIVAWAERCARPQPLVVRLVKGAYWDHEGVDARPHGWRSPGFEGKGQGGPHFQALAPPPPRARPPPRPAGANPQPPRGPPPHAGHPG